MQHTFIEGVEEVEIAWAIVPQRWREGLATELACACVQIAFTDLALPSLIAYTRTGNRASRGVMAKAGMSLEREFVDRWGLRSVLYRHHRTPSVELGDRGGGSAAAVAAVAADPPPPLLRCTGQHL